MIVREDIIRAVNESLPEGGNLFPVEVKVNGDEVEVFVDSDGAGDDGKPRGVTVDDCTALAKAIEAKFDRDVEDFSLTVSSAGIGQPLRVMRQYRKLVGRRVEVLMASGAKFVATLDDAHPGPDGAVEGGSVTLSWDEKQKIEGKKRPEIVTVTRTVPLDEIKTTKEYIDFR
ncbi:MAG: ribosome assembly cofactor RimP [Alistipes sp.]|jgi:ribosome maturation factor RimP|nr:ribosome assembly cofactor RimP [Alistipes sp.]